MARLFGFSIDDSEKTPPSVVSPVPLLIIRMDLSITSALGFLVRM